MSEADWQSQVVDLARLNGWIVAHFRPARTEQGWRTPVGADGAGFPDLVLVRERVVFAELKSQHGRLSPTQRAWQDTLQQAGAEHWVWRPSDFEQVRLVLGRRG